MKLQSKEFIAGSFVLGGLIAFLTIVSVLGSFLERTDHYFTRVNNVSGLKTGAAVIYEGYIIGSVSEVTPEASENGMSFRIDLEIKKDWRIPETSEASIAAMSLLSAVAIQIKAGEGEPLPSGAEIRASKQMNFVDEISATADNFARIAEDHLVPLMNTLNTLLEDHGASTFGNLNTLTAGLAEETPAMARNINTLVTSLDADSKQIADNVNKAVNDLDRLITSIEPKRVDRAMTRVEGILANAETASETVNDEVLPNVSTAINQGTSTLKEAENIVASFDTLGSEIQMANRQITAILAAINGLMVHGDDIMKEGKEITAASGEQLITILNRLDRAALNIEEMTNILRNNPGVLITGTE